MRPFNDFVKSNFDAARRYGLRTAHRLWCVERELRVPSQPFALPPTPVVIPGLDCRFFLDIASDCPASDTVNHSLSFISDGNVLALHRLLWNNQEKIGQYLSSNR